MTEKQPIIVAQVMGKWLGNGVESVIMVISIIQRFSLILFVTKIPLVFRMMKLKNSVAEFFLSQNTKFYQNI